MKITIKVPDMTCDHCKMTIEKSLRELSEVQKVQVDLPQKIVKISGNTEVNQVINAIRSVGYTPGEIQDIKP